MTKNRAADSHGKIQRIIWGIMLIGSSLLTSVHLAFGKDPYHPADGLIVLLAAAFGFWLLGWFKESTK